MAKVRIQARSTDPETERAELPGPHHSQSKSIGALTILARVWKREGFLGWYQVS
jgi:hypothetical protein